MTHLRLRRQNRELAESGMTLLETSLSLLFMAMFFMALLAASMGVNRMTRGFTCRVITGDDAAIEPTRGCAGQDDEVVGTDVNALRLEHHHGFRALRDDLLTTSPDAINKIAIPTGELDSVSAAQRRSMLDSRCLWEKLEPLSGGRARAQRNYLVVDSSQTGAAQLRLLQERPYRLPQGVAQPADGSHLWFIRAGHLIGERWNGPKSDEPFEPLPGLIGVSEGVFTTKNQRWQRDSVSEQELDEEADGAPDPTVYAPNLNWGLLNQVCLYQGDSDSPIFSLYLLSGERGTDLGAEKGPFFGREDAMSSRQPQPRLLFSKSPEAF